MFEQLFGSKTRVKLLQLFYTNPNRSFYVREITRKIDEQINSVRRELANLLNVGIIHSDASNNRLYYEVNQNYEHYSALSMIFGATATAPKPKANAKKSAPAAKVVEQMEHPMAQTLSTAGRVELALLTGQFTRDELSGADILAVGDINKSKMAKVIEELEKSENKEIKYVVMPMSEFEYRRQINDRFINDVLSAKKQVVINIHELVI